MQMVTGGSARVSIEGRAKRALKWWGRWGALVVAIAAGGPAGAAEPASLRGGEGPAAVEAGPLDEGIGQIPEEVLRRAVEVRGQPLVERIEAISEALLGRPYVIDPLGEGEGHDPQPLARYDVFDCLTYTEEVLALSLAGDPSHSAEVRNNLRYGDAPPAYANRHHFMELQWIPAALKNGWLEDTTSEYGEVVKLEREVTEATWKAWNRRAHFALTDEELPTGPMSLQVLPLKTAQEVYSEIRPGSVLLTVREDRSWVPIWVTHVGFVVQGDEELVFRHATRIGQGGSRDHPLRWYLQHIETYGPWKTLGVSVLEPVEQGPRLSRVSAQGPGPDPGSAAQRME